MALPATDNFNRSEDPLATDWATFSGHNDLKADGSDCVLSGSSPGAAIWDSDAFDNDQYSEAVINADGNVGVLVRASALAETTYLWHSGSSDIMQLYKNVAGAGWVQLGNQYSISRAVGEIMKLTVEGTTLTPHYDGVDQATRTDSAIASGYAGLRIYSGEWDDWEGGNVSAGTTESVAGTATFAGALASKLSAKRSIAGVL